MKDVKFNVMNYCGSLVYEFLNSDSTPGVSTSEISYNVSNKTFSMQTNLLSKVASTSLKLKVSLSEWVIVPAAIKDFKVQFINSCEPPTSTTPPIVSTMTYNLTYATALSFTVGAFTVDPNYCPLSYSFLISPTIVDATVIVFNKSTATFTVKSYDLSLAGTYTITVAAHSPGGTTLSSTSGFSLILVNTCQTATFTIDPSIIAS